MDAATEPLKTAASGLERALQGYRSLDGYEKLLCGDTGWEAT